MNWVWSKLGYNHVLNHNTNSWSKMAECSNHDDLIHCQICYDMFENPQSLKCRHVICLKCVNHMKNNGLIVCPICKVSSTVTQVEHDHRTVALVDSYQQQISQTKSAATEHSDITCESCRDPENEVSYKCESCDVILCANCQQSHSDEPNNSDDNKHQITTITDISQYMQDILKAVSNTTLEKQQHFNNTQSDFKTQLNIVNTKKSETISQIEVHELQVISEVKAHHRKLKQQVLKECEKLSSEVTKNYKSNKIAENHIHSKQVLVDNWLSVDGATLAHMATEIHEDITNVAASIPDPLPLTVDVSHFTVKPGKPFNTEDSTQVTFGPQNSGNDDQSQLKVKADTEVQDRKRDFSPVLESDYRYQKRATIESKRLKCIQLDDEHVYCLTHTSIEVYDLELTFIKFLQLSVGSCNSFIRKNDKFIIASDSGIYVCDNKGQVLQRIYPGCFIGVGIKVNIVYGCEQEVKKIFILQQTRNGWRCIGEIDLNDIYNRFKCNRTYLSFHFTGEHFYVSQKERKFLSDVLNYCIIKLDLNGKWIKEHTYGTDVVVCDADNCGKFLVVDTDGKRFQIGDNNGRFQNVHFRGSSVSKLMYGSFSADYRSLWIADNSDGKGHIEKYVATELPAL